MFDYKTEESMDHYILRLWNQGYSAAFIRMRLQVLYSRSLQIANGGSLPYWWNQ